MSMFIASANTNTLSTPVKVITARDIAEKLGMGLTTIHNCLTGYTCGYAKETVEKIQTTAKEMGYDPKKARSHRRNLSVSKTEKPKKHYWGGNFYSREEEITRMTELRNEGYSNAEIAKKIGRTYECVLYNIGKQPADMTSAKHSEAQRIRRVKESNRKAFVESHKVAVHNDTVRKVNELTEKMNANMAEIRELRKVHDEMVAAIATTESDIRKIAEKMGLEVMEIKPVVIPVTETNTVVQTSFLN